MRAGISLLNLRPGRVGGTETYLRRLLTHLPAAAGPDEIVVVMGRDVAPAVETPDIQQIGRASCRERVYVLV